MQETVTEASGLKPKPVRRILWFWSILLCLLVVGSYFFLNRGGKTQPQTATAPGQKGAAPGMQATPVLAVPAGKGDMGVYLTGLGNVTPLNTVTVKSRVDGQLMEVHYREGQNVRKGDLLAVIDPRPFQVQLTQAEGQMARDRELLNNARLDLRRFKELWDQDSIARQQYDTQEALVRQLEGAVKVDQGQIDSARLQLAYSRITSPISGRVGLRLMDAGNIVHANDPGGLVVITQVQPITVVFPIPEDSLPPLLARLRKGARLTVEALDREEKQKLATGTLLTVDNQIDPTTGTVKLKAAFPNTGNELFPNQFVNARLLLETRHDMVIIPSAAIQRGPQGTFVYVVKADKTVGLRPVTIGVSEGGDTSVTKGLEAGELVVADGAERLREGSRVEPKGPGGPKGTDEANKQDRGAPKRPY